MTNTSSKDKKLLELQAALQKLRESEINCIKAAAQYAELETIIRKQLKSHFSEAVAFPVKTESNTSCKGNTKSITSSVGSKLSSKSSKTTAVRLSDKVQRKSSDTPLSLKKSSGDTSKTSSEHLKNNQVVKRIRQCHESIDNIAMLSEKIGSEKKKFIMHLDKLNTDTWKSQKSKHPLIAKLQTHMSSSK